MTRDTLAGKTKFWHTVNKGVTTPTVIPSFILSDRFVYM